MVSLQGLKDSLGVHAFVFFSNHHPPVFPDSPRDALAEVSTQHIKSLSYPLGHTWL